MVRGRVYGLPGLGAPRILENSYELAHTEYKITLGMAAGLPALASPQASYVQALSNGGGYICSTETEWSNHLMDLFHNETKRLELGKIARQNTVANYSIHAVATRYARFLSAFVKLS
jgi:glycosyltransferase involved in cell wall biosynthesis